MRFSWSWRQSWCRSWCSVLFLAAGVSLTLLMPKLSHGQQPNAIESTDAYGPLYPVKEADLRDLLKRHARENAALLASRLSASKASLARQAAEPAPLTLPRNRVRATHQEILAPLPTRLIGENYFRRWLFIDARYRGDLALAKDFLEKARAQGQTTLGARVILTGGNVAQTQKQLATRVWFDQNGTLTRRLKVHGTPACVTLSAEKILVQEWVGRDQEDSDAH